MEPLKTQGFSELSIIHISNTRRSANRKQSINLFYVDICFRHFNFFTVQLYRKKNSAEHLRGIVPQMIQFHTWYHCKEVRSNNTQNTFLNCAAYVCISSKEQSTENGKEAQKSQQRTGLPIWGRFPDFEWFIMARLKYCGDTYLTYRLKFDSPNAI